MSVPAILTKVATASGAKYSSGNINASTVRTRPTYSVSNTGANEDDWGDAPPVVESEVTKVQSSYRPTKVDITSIKSATPKSSPFANTPAEPVRGSYQPVGKVDIAAIRAQAKDDKFNPKPGPLQSAYKPHEKVDIAALRAQAGKKPSSFASEPKVTPAPELSKPAADEEEYKPSSVHDRMKAFGGTSAPAPAGGDDEDEAPKALKDRMKSYQSNAERLTELPKPKTKNAVAGRFGAGAASSGTTPPLPSSSYGGASKVVTGASRDFGSSGGKTPAQLWAEKHAKQSGASVPAPAPVAAPEPEEEEIEEEAPSISTLRSNFASTSISSQPEEVEEEVAPNVSDLKSRFAQRFAASSPSQDESPESGVPSLPTRSAAPSLPSVARPEPEEEEEEEEIAPIVAERSLPPPLPTAGRALPPAFVPPTVSVPVVEPKEEEEEVAPPPSLPTRAAEPEEESADGLPQSAVVLFTYEKDDENEIGLTEGEQITVLKYTDSDWWLGADAHGETGLFPAEYVQVLKPPYAIASFDYVATESNELSFPEGAYITEIEFDDEAWWSGVYEGQRNLFPSNYVELKKK